MPIRLISKTDGMTCIKQWPNGKCYRGENGLVRAFLTLCFVLAWSLFEAQALAQDVEQKYDFDIREETLGPALDAIVRQTKLVILYPFELSEMSGINPVVGKYSVSEALDIMLQGTRFTGGLTESGTMYVSLNNQKNTVDRESEMNKSVAKTSLLSGIAAFLFGSGADVSVAQTNDAPSARIDEIIVTARKREENAQDAPLSLVVATGDMLRNRSVAKFADLQVQTPSFQTNPSLFGNTSLILSSRGLSLTDIRLNIDPVVGIYLDDIYLPRAVGINAADLVDIQRVEVLAGPQGTLFGKNTSGGAVRIFTNMPTDELEGLVRFRAGNYGETAATGVLNVPLSDTFAIRTVANMSNNDGYGTNHYDGSSVGEFDSSYFRGTALWTPNERLTVTVRGDYTNSDSVNAVYKGFQTLAGPTPGVGNGGPLATVEAALEINNITGGLTAWNALPEATRNAYIAEADAQLRAISTGDPSDGSNDITAVEDMKIWGASFEMDYELTDNLSLNWLSAVRYFEREGATDLDGTPFIIINYPYLYAEETQYSTELQLSGSFLDGRLNSVSGVYYAVEDGDEVSHQQNLGLIGGATSLGIQDAEIETDSLGLFTQHTYAITEQLKATVGARWTQDSRELISRNSNAVTCLSLGRSLADLGGIENCVRPMDTDFEIWSYTGSLEYSPTEDLLIYGTTRRGHRAGGLQEAVAGATVAAANTAFIPFGPEIVEDYEVGIKSLLFDHRVRLNINYYHSDISGAMRFTPRPVPGTVTTIAAVQNAAKIDVDGVEFDVLFMPIPEIELNVTGAWTDARFKEYVTLVGEDRSNLPVQYSPKWRYNISAAYIADLSMGPWRTQVDYMWTDDQLTVEPGAYNPSHELVNIRSSIHWEPAGIEVALYTKNVTDERFTPSPIDLSALGGVTAGPYNQPRTYGIEITKHF